MQFKDMRIQDEIISVPNIFLRCGHSQKKERFIRNTYIGDWRDIIKFYANEINYN